MEGRPHRHLPRRQRLRRHGPVRVRRTPGRRLRRLRAARRGGGQVFQEQQVAGRRPRDTGNLRLHAGSRRIQSRQRQGSPAETRLGLILKVFI